MKTAVIGVGNMGQHHARNYAELSQLVAVSDASKERAEEIAKKYNCKAYTNYTEMLEKEKPDAVTIAVPTTMHAQIAKECLRRGVHVLVEKPITSEINDAEELITLAQEKNLKLMVGQIEVFNPAVTALKKTITEGKLGEIKTIITKRVGIFPSQIKDANVIIDLAVHDISVINHLLDKNNPEVVASRKGSAIAENRADYADILLSYGNTNAFLQVNWITPVKIRNLSITGTKGYAELDYINQELTLYENNCTKKTFGSYGEFIVEFQPKQTKIEVNKAEPLKLEIKSFLESIETNQKPVVDGKMGRDILATAKRC